MADLALHTLLLCDYAITAQDGKISAIGVFSQINVTRMPATHGRCFIVAILEATPGPHELTIQVIAPSGQAIAPAGAAADDPGPADRHEREHRRRAEGHAARGDRPPSDRGPCG